jgi:hypothetical protein
MSLMNRPDYWVPVGDDGAPAVVLETHWVGEPPDILTGSVKPYLNRDCDWHWPAPCTHPRFQTGQVRAQPAKSGAFYDGCPRCRKGKACRKHAEVLETPSTIW